MPFDEPFDPVTDRDMKLVRDIIDRMFVEIFSYAIDEEEVLASRALHGSLLSFFDGSQELLAEYRESPNDDDALN